VLGKENVLLDIWEVTLFMEGQQAQMIIKKKAQEVEGNAKGE
jgi:hypothetical protein